MLFRFYIEILITFFFLFDLVLAKERKDHPTGKKRNPKKNSPHKEDNADNKRKSSLPQPLLKSIGNTMSKMGNLFDILLKALPNKIKSIAKPVVDPTPEKPGKLAEELKKGQGPSKDPKKDEKPERMSPKNPMKDKDRSSNQKQIPQKSNEQGHRNSNDPSMGLKNEQPNKNNKPLDKRMQDFNLEDALPDPDGKTPFNEAGPLQKKPPMANQGLYNRRSRPFVELVKDLLNKLPFQNKQAQNSDQKEPRKSSELEDFDDDIGDSGLEDFDDDIGDQSNTEADQGQADTGRKRNSGDSQNKPKSSKRSNFLGWPEYLAKSNNARGRFGQTRDPDDPRLGYNQQNMGDFPQAGGSPNNAKQSRAKYGAPGFTDNPNNRYIPDIMNRSPNNSNKGSQVDEQGKQSIPLPKPSPKHDEMAKRAKKLSQNVIKRTPHGDNPLKEPNYCHKYYNFIPLKLYAEKNGQKIPPGLESFKEPILIGEETKDPTSEKSENCLPSPDEHRIDPPQDKCTKRNLGLFSFLALSGC